MLLGFKRRFEPFVLDGLKTHTIRGLRKTPPKVGEICHCYVDPRQKTMRLLGRWPCVKVESIQIEGGWETRTGDWLGAVHINDCRLDSDEEEQLARRDGFESFSEMMLFWRGRLPFDGKIIHWDYSRPIARRAA